MGRQAGSAEGAEKLALPAVGVQHLAGGRRRHEVVDQGRYPCAQLLRRDQPRRALDRSILPGQPLFQRLHPESEEAERLDDLGHGGVDLARRIVGFCPTAAGRDTSPARVGNRRVDQRGELRPSWRVGAETLSHLGEIGQEVPRVAALRPQARKGVVQRFGRGVPPGRHRTLGGRITRLR